MTPVVFIMIDGLRPDAIAQADSPNLDSLMRRGAFSLKAQSVMPSMTLPCHMSIFHSVPPERHGVTTNTWQPMARPLPGLVDVAKNADLRCAAFTSWEPLRDLSQPGSLHYALFTDSVLDFERGDQHIAEHVATYIPVHKPDFTFIYFGVLDNYAHWVGWMSEEYINFIGVVDRALGTVMEVLPEETTILLQSDHGGHDRNHGTDDPQDMTIPWIIAGPDIRQNHELQSDVSLLDTAPTIARILGISPHRDWEGRCIDEAFI